uniref:DUF1618 domain-containing protein n=1 Tax=Oryza punctata TaxID=4537 RepID=A0A0E0JZZ0_ORYPU
MVLNSITMKETADAGKLHQIGCQATRDNYESTTTRFTNNYLHQLYDYISNTSLRLSTPPPASILLEPYGYFSDRTNDTTARGLTRDGKAMATPPHASFFTLHSPDMDPSAFADLPKAVCSDDDLLLLHIPICHRGAHVYANNNHYFVYHAAGDGKQRLTPVPMPQGLTFTFPDREVVLLRRHDHDTFFLAVLNRSSISRQYSHNQFYLHLYNSETGKWNTKLVNVDDSTITTVGGFKYSCANMVIVMGRELGSVGWVDLWQGILVCDILLDNPSLRYIPLPSPLVPRLLSGYPMFLRNIIVLEEYIKYFDMYKHTGFASAQGWVAATKKMKISSIGSGNSSWEDDCAIKFSEVPVDSLTLAQMLLPNLQQALVIAVDMRNKTLKGVADFGFGRPVGYTFTYLQTGISKHLSNCSSTRSIRNANESRDGILGAGEKVPGEGVATAA